MGSGLGPHLLLTRLLSDYKISTCQGHDPKQILARRRVQEAAREGELLRYGHPIVDDRLVYGGVAGIRRKPVVIEVAGDGGRDDDLLAARKSRRTENRVTELVRSRLVIES